MNNCMACGKKLTSRDYPRKPKVIGGVMVKKPIVCWEGSGCLVRAKKRAKDLALWELG
jgi:hypothetical protein